jgi:4-amino-4-deoxy-L-arabinose transferase-like glycosyltransferase
MDAVRRRWQLLVLLLLVAVCYFPRLTGLPVRGEETRWAEGAVNMIHSGDWIVPRQQGELYVDRPPMSSWSMAAVGLVRGKVDIVAIRLPSVLAILLTTLAIYLYARTFLTPTGALAAGAAFASLVQVLQIGRVGENEALFTLLVSGALMAWHTTYLRGGSRAMAWSIGYTLVGLAALLKGIQGPVYFASGVGLFLLVRRDWRWLFCWGHVLGWCCLLAVISAWWLPFYAATNCHSAIGIWTTTVVSRFGSSHMLRHVLMFPFETFGCMLPWSLLLLGIVWPAVRRTLGRPPQQIVFVASAVALPYLSLLIASSARGRYFMPMYPLVAVAVGWFVERCAAAEAGSLPRRRWNIFLIIMATVGLVGAGGLLAASLMPNPTGVIAVIRQSPAFAIALMTSAVALAAVMWWALRTPGPVAVEVGVLAITGLLGLAYVGPMINIQERKANDMSDPVAQFKTLIPDPDHIVSLGPIHHRFAWYYKAPIKQVRWPLKSADLPQGVTYFLMEWSYGDTPELRSMGPGLFDPPTPGTLPFTWERVAFLQCDPDKNDDPRSGVILGRVVSTTQTAANGNPRGSEPH